MGREPVRVRRPSDGKVRIYGLGWVKPWVAVLLGVILVIMLVLIGFGY